MQLTAPLNFDYENVETAEVLVRLGSVHAKALTVTEDSPNARTFSGRLRAPSSTATAVEVSYGFGYLAHRATLK